MAELVKYSSKQQRKSVVCTEENFPKGYGYSNPNHCEYPFHITIGNDANNNQYQLRITMEEAEKLIAKLQEQISNYKKQFPD